MWSTLPEVLPFWKARSQSQAHHEVPSSVSPKSNRPPVFSALPPCLRVTLERTSYRPGDTIFATITVLNGDRPGQVLVETSSSDAEAVLMEDLVVGIKGIEKLDPQWLLLPGASPSSQLRKGERMILELQPTSLVSNVIVRHGSCRTYEVRATLPNVLPPSYRGTAVQYVYYLYVKMSWSPAVSVSENRKGFQYTPVEVRTTFNIWTMPEKSGLTADDLRSTGHYGVGGIVPVSPIDLEVEWRENSEHADTTWMAENFSGNEDDENGSQLTDSATLSPPKAEYGEHYFVASSPSTPRRSSSVGPRRRNEAFSWKHSTPSSLAAPGLENGQRALIHCHSASDSKLVNKKGTTSFWQGASGTLTASACSEEGFGDFDSLVKRNSMLRENGNGSVSARGEDDGPLGSPMSFSVQYARGKTYNIRIDDQILVRFSPRTPQSIYHFGDVVSGTLSFFHEEGARRCLQVSVSLETREQLSPELVHPSRKNSPTINKVQSEYSEVVADILNTSFIFSIPADGPASFCTPVLSVQWVLRFEFVASPSNVDWSLYESALQVDERERGEWSLPILVHAPLPRSKIPGIIKERPLSPKKDGWLRSPREVGGSTDPFKSSPRSSSLWHLY